MDVLHKDVSKTKTVKQHFVPQFYLKEFTDSNEFIHIFNFETQKYHKSRPKDFCYQKNLYETQWENANSELGEYVLQNDIEKIFSNYEGKYAEFLKRLKNICTRSQNPNAIILNAKEKNIFYSFVVNFIVRNPESMNLLKLNEIPENINESECIMDIRRLLEELNFGVDRKL